MPCVARDGLNFRRSAVLKATAIPIDCLDNIGNLLGKTVINYRLFIIGQEKHARGNQIPPHKQDRPLS